MVQQLAAIVRMLVIPACRTFIRLGKGKTFAA